MEVLIRGVAAALVGWIRICLRSSRMTMYDRQCTVMLVLLLCCMHEISGDSENPSKGRCFLDCTAPEVQLGEIRTHCHISEPLKVEGCFEEIFQQLENISYLDLSANNLSEVPRSLLQISGGNLTTLSLEHNNIKTIEAGTFTILKNLQSLFLSFNDLREWKADPENELQWLNYLDVTGNEHLRPSEQLLKLKRLEKVEGVTWTQYCKNCSLVNIETVDAEANSTPWCYEELHSPHGWYWYDGIKYGKALAFIKLGFWPTCLCDTPCYEHQLELPYMKAVVYINAKVSYILYVTCPAGLLVNIAVVLVILRNPSLRRDLAVCLVANIAVCDAFIVLACLIYSIYLTDWKFVDHYTEMLSPEALEEDFDNGIMDFDSKTMRLRNIIGPILTFAVASEVLGSLILTFEKFLKIVYAMRPSLRITKRGAQVYLFISGICCAVFAVLPAFEVGRMSYNILIDVMPVPSDFRTGECDRMPEIRTAAAVQIALLIIQLVSLLLYLPIFLVARKSGANVGIKRETTIARKIALLVFTNLFFFVIPMILGIFACAIVNVYGAYIEENWQEYALESYHWYLASQETLPILCVTINAILNPFIVAVRHPKIKQKIGVITARCSTAVNRFLGFLRQSVHRCHNSDKTEQENNNIEMLHTDET